MKYKILIVDDEAANLRMLERLFRGEFDVVSAASGAEGLEMLALHDIALILSDQRMPGMTGIEFLKRAAEMRPQCVRMILTGYTDAGDLVEALNSNVIYKYITKPWEGADLMLTVKRGLSHFETVKAQHRLNLENQRLRERLDSAEDAFQRVFTQMLRLKSENGPEHASRTRETAEQIGRALNFEPAMLRQLSTAAYLHGVAEVFSPDHLLYKTGAWTDEEKRELNECRETALELLEDSPGFDDIAPMIRHASEHFDGSGAPGGLAGEQIPLNARIIAVADAFDEMTFSGTARPSLGGEEAMAALRQQAGKQFDPDVVNLFCGLRSMDQLQNLIPKESPALNV